MCNSLGLQGSEALYISVDQAGAAGLMHFGVIAFSHVG